MKSKQTKQTRSQSGESARIGQYVSMSRRQFVLSAVAGFIPRMVLGDESGRHKSGAAPKIAVCFGSGGLHGYAHIGAVRAFERIGLRPDIICGTSVGALVGVLWAAGMGSDEIESIAGEKDWYGLGWPRIPRLGIGRLDALRDMIDTRIGGRSIESLPIQFAAVATDLQTGKAVVLNRGRPGEAAAASASVPLRYEPMLINGRQLIDGALTAPVPVDAARALGADFCIAIDIAYRPREEPVTGFTDVAFQTFHILINQLIDEQIRRADFAIRLDVHSIMRDEGGLARLVREAEHAVYRRRFELTKALENMGTGLPRNRITNETSN